MPSRVREVSAWTSYWSLDVNWKLRPAGDVPPREFRKICVPRLQCVDLGYLQLHREL